MLAQIDMNVIGLFWIGTIPSHILLLIRLALSLLTEVTNCFCFVFCFISQSMTPGQRTEKHSGRKRKATVDGDSPGKEPSLHLTTKNGRP